MAPDPVEEVVAVMLMQVRPATTIRREYELLQALVHQAILHPPKNGHGQVR